MSRSYFHDNRSYYPPALNKGRHKTKYSFHPCVGMFVPYFVFVQSHADTGPDADCHAPHVHSVIEVCGWIKNSFCPGKKIHVPKKTIIKSYLGSLRDGLRSQLSEFLTN